MAERLGFRVEGLNIVESRSDKHDNPNNSSNNHNKAVESVRVTVPSNHVFWGCGAKLRGLRSSGMKVQGVWA